MTLSLGTPVRTKEAHASGHTRLPRYLQHARGVIVQLLGSFPLPDEAVEHPKETRTSLLYTVAFPAPAIFEGAEAGTICADLFEDYLEVDV